MSDIKKIYDKNLELKYSVKIPTNEMDEKINQEAEKEKDKIKIDGFRKGKVPLDIIKNKFSATLLNDVAQNLVEENIQKLIKDNDYKLISRPEINIKKLDINSDFEFEISLILYPKIPEIKYEKIKLKKQNIKLTDKDIQEGIQKLVKSKAKWVEQDSDYKSKLGDRVKIDFLGKIDDVEFKGGKGENYNLELGSKSFIDDFEEQLLNKKSGEEVKVKVRFPKNYHQKDLADKKAVFEVKIHSISIPEIPELTDEFLKENFNIENQDKLKEMITKELTTIYESNTKNKLKNDMFEWIKKEVDVDLPLKIVDEEFNREWAPIENELKNNPNKFASEKDKQKEMENIRNNSEQSIKLGLILSEIGKANNIEVKDTEVTEEIRKRASVYPGQEGMIVDFYMKNQNALNQLTGILLEDKVVDFILSKATVKEEEVSIEDFNKE